MSCLPKNPEMVEALKCQGKATNIPPSPVVLSKKRFQAIVKTANQEDFLRKKQEIEENRKYDEYLKLEGEALVKTFKGNMQRTEEQKIQQLKAAMDKKMEETRKDVEETRESEAQKRREQIAKAEMMFQSMKQGPKALNSAMVQSEVVRVRDHQIQVKKEFEKAKQMQECMDQRNCTGQALQFMEETQEQIAEKQKRNAEYKNELLQTMNDNEVRRKELKKKQLAEQIAERKAINMEVQKQIEKENIELEKKRAILRKNALEAMHMVEQRRQRDRMRDEVEDRLVCVFQAGKNDLQNMQKAQAGIIADERKNIMEERMKGFDGSAEDKVIACEEQRLQRDLSRMAIQFTAEEAEKVRKEKAAKRARIEAHLREVELGKLAKIRGDDIKRFELARRFKNDEVNYLFKQQEKQEQAERAHLLRCQLNKQVNAKTCAQKLEKEDELKCLEDSAQKEDTYFFEKARTLMGHAVKQNRPLQPFVRVVDTYKRDNRINFQPKVPRHMATNINIGRAQPGDSRANILVPNVGAEAGRFGRQELWREKSKPLPPRPHMRSVQENMTKINEMVAATAKKDASCKQEEEIQCFKQGNRSPKRGSCSSLLGAESDKPVMRYSMADLLKMNQQAK